MNLDALFIAFLIFGWAFCAGLPWLVISARRKGRGALLSLPGALIAGWLAALAVPLVGLTDGRGLLLSFAAAMVGGGMGTVAALRLRAMMRDRGDQAPLM